MDKAALFESRLPRAEFETPAGTLLLRGLSRAEIMSLRKVGQSGDVDEVDKRMLRLGVVEPALTDADVKTWREAWPAAEIDAVVSKIAELSGMHEEETEREASSRQ